MAEEISKGKFRIESLDWHDGGGWSVVQDKAERRHWDSMVEQLDGVLDMSFRLVTETGEEVANWDSPRRSASDSVYSSMLAAAIAEGESVATEEALGDVIARWFDTDESRGVAEVGEWFRDSSGVLWFGIFTRDGLESKQKPEYDPNRNGWGIFF